MKQQRALTLTALLGAATLFTGASCGRLYEENVEDTPTPARPRASDASDPYKHDLEDADVIAETSSSTTADAADAAAAVDAADAADASTPSEYTIASSDGMYVVNNEAGGVCSGSGPSASIIFQNDGASGFRMEWVRWDDCVEQDYGVVHPKGAYTMSTFATHRWRLRRESDNRLIVDFTVELAGTYIVTVH
jgi:hypothetical protein